MRKNRFLVWILVALFCAGPGAGVSGAADEELSMDKKVSMDFERAELKDVLKIFSQQSGLNFVAAEEVENKKVTLFLDNVTVQDALDNIIKANDLRYERERGSGIFVVYPSKTHGKEPMTRVFPLKYTRLSISALDIGGGSVIKDLAVPNEKLGKSDDSESTSSSSTSFTSGSTGGDSDEDETAARGIDKVVKRLLSDRGSVTVDLRTNSLIVTDLPQYLDRVDEVLRAIDVPTRQVMIEVEILEIRATVLQNTGVEWGGDDGSLFTFTGGVRGAGFPFSEALFNGLDPATNAKSSLTLGTLSAANFKATLHFLMTFQDTKILARPRVLTINNEAALIKLVTNTAIAKVSQQSSSEGVSVTTTDTAERTDTGIVMKMTPQINEDDTIELFLEPSVTTVAASTFFAADFLDPTTRSVRTTVRVRDAETLVIGGLIDSDDSHSESKMPFFGDLPLVGNAFKYKDNTDADRELLIFLTPHIVSHGASAETGTLPAARSKKMAELLRESDMKRTVKESEMQRALDRVGGKTSS